MRIDHDALADDLRELIAIPSVGGSQGEVDVQQWCADKLADLGLDVDHWQLDLAALRSTDGYPGEEVERLEAWGVVAASGPGTPALILNGHVDVVPPGDLSLWPNGNPFIVRAAGGTWYGRGAADMKSGVAAIIAAARAFTGTTLARPFAVHTVIGEEDGGLGSFATLQRGHTGGACLIAEPTDGQIISANAGALTFQLEISGAAAHGSTRTAGVSAIDKFEIVHAALREFEAERNASLPPAFAHLDLGWPLSIGTIRAGDWPSTVPDILIAEGRYGVMPGETLNSAKRSFARVIAAASQHDSWLHHHPVRITWPGGHFSPGQLPVGHELLSLVQQSVEDAGVPRPEAFGGAYGSDLRQYSQRGIPTVQYGPGSIRHAHSVEEQVEFDQVLSCAKAYANLIAAHCS